MTIRLLSCGPLLAALLGFAACLRAALVDMSPPLQDVQAEYTGFEMVCRVFDPAQNQWIEDRTPAGIVLEALNRNGVVAWSSGTAFNLRTYDPSRTNWVKLTLAASTAQDLRSHRGLTAWSSGNQVHCHVYEPATGQFYSESVASSTFDLRSIDGVVSWTSGNAVFLRTFNPALRRWEGLNVAGGPTFDLSSTNGLVAWSNGNVIRTRIYDALRNRWMGDDAATGAPLGQLWNDSGLVAWSTGGILWTRLFNPATGQWVPGQLVSASGTAMALGITNTTAFWSDGLTTTPRRLGYDWYKSAWSTNATLALPVFAVSTNAGNPPLSVRFTDLSVGATAQSWNFGDGSSPSLQRSPSHVFTSLGRFPVTLTLAGLGTNTVFRTNILTDLEAPTGSVVINHGATSTTNRNVTLTLAATDNSGSVPQMRLSNDGVTWQAWEPFAPTKAWQLEPGVTTRTVHAQFEDPFGNQSAVVTDSIFLDTTPPPNARFAINATNVIEQTRTFTFAVTLDHPMSSRAVRVDYATVDGTATAGSDYVAASGTLIYPAGVTTQFVSVQILDDTLVELDETFSIELRNPVDVIPGDPLVITILDNDLATVRFSADRFTANEGDGAGLLHVILSAPSGQHVTVGYAATNGTAVAGVDFVPVTGRLTFLPGQTTQTISVPILDDLEDEFTETVLVRLEKATNATLGLPSTAILEIIDNDPPTVNFATTEYHVGKGDGSAPIAVTLTKPYAQTVLVNYLTQGGTAVPGKDYVVASGTLIFSPGQTNRLFHVTLLPNPAAGAGVTVGLQLSDFVNVLPGPRIQASLVIGAADALTLTALGFDALGGFHLRISGPPGGRVRVETAPDLGPSPVWEVLGTLDNPTGTVEFSDPAAAGQVRRYYRAQTVP